MSEKEQSATTREPGSEAPRRLTEKICWPCILAAVPPLLLTLLFAWFAASALERGRDVTGGAAGSQAAAVTQQPISDPETSPAPEQAADIAALRQQLAFAEEELAAARVALSFGAGAEGSLDAQIAALPLEERQSLLHRAGAGAGLTAAPSTAEEALGLLQSLEAEPRGALFAGLPGQDGFNAWFEELTGTERRNWLEAILGEGALDAVSIDGERSTAGVEAERLALARSAVLDAELSELREAQAAAEEQALADRAEIERLGEELAQAQAELQTAQDAAQTLKNEKTALEARLTEQQAAHERALTEAGAEADTALAELRAQLTEAEAARTAAQAEAQAEVDAAREEAQAALLDLQTTQRETTAAVDAAQARAEQAIAERDLARDQLQRVNLRLEALQRGDAPEQTAEAGADPSSDADAALLAQTRAELREVEARLEEADNLRREAEREAAQAQAELSSRDARLASMQSAAERASQDAESVEARHASEIERLTAELDAAKKLAEASERSADVAVGGARAQNQARILQLEASLAAAPKPEDVAALEEQLDSAEGEMAELRDQLAQAREEASNARVALPEIGEVPVAEAEKAVAELLERRAAQIRRLRASLVAAQARSAPPNVVSLTLPEIGEIPPERAAAAVQTLLDERDNAARNTARGLRAALAAAEARKAPAPQPVSVTLPQIGEISLEDAPRAVTALLARQEEETRSLRAANASLQAQIASATSGAETPRSEPAATPENGLEQDRRRISQLQALNASLRARLRSAQSPAATEPEALPLTLPEIGPVSPDEAPEEVQKLLAVRDRDLRALRAENVSLKANLASVESAAAAAPAPRTDNSALATMPAWRAAELQEIAGDKLSALSAPIAFDSASAELTREGREAVRKLAVRLLKSLKSDPQDDWRLVIEGHTDQLPIRTKEFASNWDLSAARAAAVTWHLHKLGVPPSRLLAIGRAASSPIDPRWTKAAFAKNRRIELSLLRRGEPSRAEEK